MPTTTALEAQAAHPSLRDEVDATHKSAPVTENDYHRAVAETLYLLSIPDMRASILEGMATSVAACSDAVGWETGDVSQGSE